MSNTRRARNTRPDSASSRRTSAKPWVRWVGILLLGLATVFLLAWLSNVSGLWKGGIVVAALLLAGLVWLLTRESAVDR